MYSYTTMRSSFLALVVGTSEGISEPTQVLFADNQCILYRSEEKIKIIHNTLYNMTNMRAVQKV